MQRSTIFKLLVKMNPSSQCLFIGVSIFRHLNNNNNQLKNDNVTYFLDYFINLVFLKQKEREEGMGKS